MWVVFFLTENRQNEKGCNNKCTKATLFPQNLLTGCLKNKRTTFVWTEYEALSVIGFCLWPNVMFFLIFASFYYLILTCTWFTKSVSETHRKQKSLLYDLIKSSNIDLYKKILDLIFLLPSWNWCRVFSSYLILEKRFVRSNFLGTIRKTHTCYSSRFYVFLTLFFVYIFILVRLINFFIYFNSFVYVQISYWPESLFDGLNVSVQINVITVIHSGKN